MKSLFRMGGLILILLVVGLVVFSFFLNSIIKSSVETIGTTITGTAVTLEEIELSPLSGLGRLHNLTIANPRGFHTEHAFNLGTVYIKADLLSALSETVIVHEILIDSPEISFEGTLSGSNLGQIQKNVDAFAQSGKRKEKQDNKGGRSPPESTGEKKIQIEQFILKNAKVTVGTPLLQASFFTILLPAVQIKSIGKQPGGATLKEISSLIFSETQRAVEQEIAKSGKLVSPKLKKIEKEFDGILKDASKMLEGIFKK